MTPRGISKIWLSIFSTVVCAAACGSVAAQQADFPYVGEITAEGVNVRAGQSANFERVCQLEKGDDVIVVDKQFSWYKIQLPDKANSYIHKQYVQYLGQKTGGITADKVNIRAGAGIHFTALGQLSKGETVTLEEELEEWYRIRPVPGSYGWVTGEFIALKSTDTSTYQEALASRLPKEEVLEKIAQELPVDQSKAEDQGKGLPQKESISAASKKARVEPVIPDNGILSVVGYVEAYEKKGEDRIYYKIVQDGEPVCYVQGPNQMLGRFMHQKVTVDGTVNQKLLSKYSRPVLTVSKIRLMI